MKPFICLVSPDARLRRHFGRGKEAIIPREAFLRGPLANQQVSSTVVAWIPNSPLSPTDLESFLLSRARDHDACIVVVDTAWRTYVQNITIAMFVAAFEGEAVGHNPGNFFFGLFARMLRNFAQVFDKFRRGDDAKLLALPTRNFKADELNEIVSLLRDKALEGSLNNDLEEQLSGLRQRVRPRRRSAYKATYAVDDHERFFIYGLETHSQFATGAPHQPSCELTGLFRFGIRLDHRRHYNVSETEGDHTTISGEFADCHSQVHTVIGRTHLNMFANDYF